MTLLNCKERDWIYEYIEYDGDHYQPESGPKFMEFYKDNKIHVMLVTLGRGTAGNEVWDYLGLESPEKAVLVSIVTTHLWTELKKGLEKKLQIDIPGNGIAFTGPPCQHWRKTGASVFDRRSEF